VTFLDVCEKIDQMSRIAHSCASEKMLYVRICNLKPAVHHLVCENSEKVMLQMYTFLWL